MNTLLKFLLKGFKYAITVDMYILIPLFIIFGIVIIIGYFKNKKGKDD